MEMTGGSHHPLATLVRLAREGGVLWGGWKDGGAVSCTPR